MKLTPCWVYPPFPRDRPTSDRNLQRAGEVFLIRIDYRIKADESRMTTVTFFKYTCLHGSKHIPRRVSDTETHTHTHTQMHMHMHIHVHKMHMHIWMHTSAYTRTHAYTYIHTHTNAQSFRLFFLLWDFRGMQNVSFQSGFHLNVLSALSLFLARVFSINIRSLMRSPFPESNVQTT